MIELLIPLHLYDFNANIFEADKKIVVMHQGYRTYALKKEVELWLMKNIYRHFECIAHDIGDSSYMGYICFSDEKDAVLFKMVWL